jgi:hypothetical protein
MRFSNAVQWVQVFLIIMAVYLAPNLSPAARRWAAVIFGGAALFHYLTEVKGLF